MGKSYKDTANYHRFHETDGPTNPKVRQEMDNMSHDYGVGHRLGHQRKSKAREKVTRTRQERAQGRQQFNRELEKME